MMVDLACKEVKNFEQTNIERYKELGEEIRILEGEVMQIKLNGYKTVNPYGRKAKELEAAMFISLSPEKAIKELEYRIQKFFNHEIRFHSFPFAGFVVARDLYPAESDFLFLDAAGEISDLAKASDDVLEESISFPYGKNYFIRSLSKELGYDMNESASLFDLYLSGHASKETSSLIADAMIGTGKEWLKAFQESLSEISGSKPVPERVFLTADADIARLFKSLIEKEEIHQYTITRGKFNVIILEPGILQPFCRVGRRAEFDPFLILESIFINRL
jgi:cell division ATPase FtsA